jgi:16S rRNA (guanine527-N7)-methyltransferase
MIGSESEARDWLRTLPECDDKAMARLERLVKLLTEENRRQNLVSEASLAEVWRRHVADSAQLLRLVPRETSGPWLDLGTGAGFPGLVIAILQPDREVAMVESRARRADWLEQARIELGLSRAIAGSGRVEAIETRAFAVISARAFAPLDRLLGLSARFSTPATHWLLPKGRSARDELASLRGWNHLFHVEQSLTDAEAGVITGTLQGTKGRKT